MGKENNVYVSVIIPIYNVENSLNKCIESVLQQTLNNIELILVDDGSSDHSGSICDEYAKRDSRIYVIHKENGGVSKARNCGLKVAIGEYIILIDSDDWLEKNACEILYNTAKKDNADIVVADINRVTLKGIFRLELFQKPFLINDKDDKAKIEQMIISTLYPRCCKNATSRMGYGGPWNKLIRKELITSQDISFNEEVGGLCDDRIFNATVYANSSKISYIQEVVYNYVDVGTSITKSYKPNIWKFNNNMFVAYKLLIDSYFKNEKNSDNRWSNEMKEAFYCFVMWRLDVAINLYTFNKKNKERYLIKRKELLNELHNEPYLTAKRNVNKKVLANTTKVFSILASLNMVDFMWLFFKLKEILKKVYYK